MSVGESLPQAILCWSVQAEVLVGAGGGHAAARRPVEKADLNQEGFVDLFDRVFLFAHRGGERADADRAAAELVDDGAQQPPVDLVEAARVDLEQPQRVVGHGAR